MADTQPDKIDSSIVNNVPVMKKRKGDKDQIALMVDDVIYTTRPNKKYSQRKPYKPANPKIITSFMPGNIPKVMVKPGQDVKEGDELCILEAMKMKNIILAPADGKIKRVNVKEGDVVPKNHALVELK